MFYGNLQILVIRSKLVITSSLVNKFANWCNVLSTEGVIVCGPVPECAIMFDEIPISTIKLHEGRFQTFHDTSLSEELR